MSTPQRIRLELFGRPTAETVEGSLPLTPMQWALVAVVYGEPSRRVGRTSISRSLWSGEPDAATRRRLSQLLYEVEQRTGQGFFLKSGSSIRPNPELVSSDLVDFYESIGSEELGPAARLLARGFLEGIPEIPTTAFDRWLDERTAVLRADLRKRATERWVRAEDEALWNQRTRDAAEALLYLDPRSEAALRRSMWAQAMSGAPLEAIAALEGFVEIGGLESDEALEEETRTVLERVKALARHRKGTHIERPRPSRADPTLFGREGDVASLLPIVAGAISEGITVVAVAGEAGLGKTRLVRECLEPAMLQGRLILHTMLAELERDIPLNALIEAMATQDIARALLALEEPWRSVILNLMPDFGKVVGEPVDLPYVQPASLQRRLLESVRLLIDEVVQEQPVLMFIDDFHWADDSSLAALSYMRRRWSVGSLVLVVAYRPEHVAPESTVARFLEADSVRHVALGPIGDVARKQLIKEAAGGEVPDDVADGLRDLGGGNPLFLIELARQWSEGELVLPRRKIEPIRLPGSIQQLFERRLQGLGGDATRVLEALSVLAKRVPTSVVRMVSGLEDREVTDGLEPLDRAGLLRWGADGVEVWHGLVRQAVLGRTSEARLRWLHGEVAGYLLQVDQTGLADEIALHFDRAFMKEEAFEYSLAAADQAEEVGAVPEVLLLLQMCERNAPRDRLLGIQLRRTQTHHLQCEYSTALEIADGDEIRGASLSTEEVLRLRALRWDCRAHLDQTHPQALLDENRAIREDARAAGSWEIVALALASVLHFGQRIGFVEPEPLLWEMDECTAAPDPRARSVAHRLSVWRRSFDDVHRSRWHAEEAVRIAKANDLPDLLPRAFNVLLVLMYMDAELGNERGEQLQLEALESARASGDLLGHLRLLSNIGAFYMDVGELDRSKSLLDEAMRVRLAADVQPEGAHCSMNRAELGLELGDLSLAEELFAGVLPERCGTRWIGWPTALAGLGLCKLAGGDVRQAAQLGRRLDEELVGPVRFPVDLTLVARFRSQLAHRQAHSELADGILRSAEDEVGRQNRAGYLKLRWERARLAARAEMRHWRELAEEGQRSSSDLGLTRRRQQFDSLLST